MDSKLQQDIERRFRELAEKFSTNVGIAQLLAENSRNEELFTVAWKEGVRLAGEGHFGPATVDTATDYRQLRPIRDSIEPVLGVMSPGQCQFMLAMYSFFNDEVAGEMAGDFNFSKSVNGLAYKLDENRKAVIARLIVHYPGW